ncbi:MAG: peptide deformylase [Candidatus Nomurabacteria bacterium]|nr:peptide deformylase [Candidatus Nomurabacteria bacterium]
MKILMTPAASLREPSQKIGEITPAIKKLADEMIKLSLEWEDEHPHEISSALAAPQVGENVRMIVVRNNSEDKSDKEFTALINPRVVSESGRLITDWEGCLSVPALYGKVARRDSVKVAATLLDGTEVKIKADGHLARTMLHEIDHLNGVLFVDKIRGKKKSFARLHTEDGALVPVDYAEIADDADLWGD